MGKQPSYEDLQKRIELLEKELFDLKTKRAKIPSNMNPLIFFEISEHSKNAIEIFESNANAKSFTIKYFNKKAEQIENIKKNIKYITIFLNPGYNPLK